MPKSDVDLRNILLYVANIAPLLAELLVNFSAIHFTFCT